MVRTTPEGMIPDIPNDNRENDVIGTRMTIVEQLCRIVLLSRFGASSLVLISAPGFCEIKFDFAESTKR